VVVRGSGGDGRMVRNGTAVTDWGSVLETEELLQTECKFEGGKGPLERKS